MCTRMCQLTRFFHAETSAATCTTPRHITKKYRPPARGIAPCTRVRARSWNWVQPFSNCCIAHVFYLKLTRIARFPIINARETWRTFPLKNVDAPVGIVAVRVPVHVRVEMLFHCLQPKAVPQELRNTRPYQVRVVHDREVGGCHSGRHVLVWRPHSSRVCQGVRGFQEGQRVGLELVRFAASRKLAVSAARAMTEA